MSDIGIAEPELGPAERARAGLAMKCIPSWTRIPCEQCGCEYQASRAYSVTAARFFCGDCETWERASAEAEQRCAARIEALESENARLGALLREAARLLAEGGVP